LTGQIRKQRKTLPAIPAVATTTTIAATAAASTTTATSSAITTPATASATTAVATASSAATGALGLWARFVDHQVPASKVLAVQRGHRAICFFIIGDFDEGEPTRLAGETVANETDGGRIHSNLTKPFLQLLFGSVEREVTYVELLHLADSFCPEPKHDCGAHCETTTAGRQSGGLATGSGEHQWSSEWSRKLTSFATNYSLEPCSGKTETRNRKKC
jgi:hypothetical protein